MAAWHGWTGLGLVLHCTVFYLCHDLFIFMVVVDVVAIVVAVFVPVVNLLCVLLCSCFCLFSFGF